MEFTGTVVVLIPTDDDCERLAAAGGDPEYNAEDVHCTLTYVGGEFVTDGQVDKNIEEAKRAAKRISSFDARVAGAGYIGQDRAAMALVQAFELLEIQDRFKAFAPRSRFPGYIPHITVGYDTRSLELVFDMLPETVRFNRLAVFSRGDRFEFPLI